MKRFWLSPVPIHPWSSRARFVSGESTSVLDLGSRRLRPRESRLSLPGDGPASPADFIVRLPVAVGCTGGKEEVDAEVAMVAVVDRVVDTLSDTGTFVGFVFSSSTTRLITSTALRAASRRNLPVIDRRFRAEPDFRACVNSGVSANLSSTRR